jgi:hypothetical protein
MTRNDIKNALTRANAGDQIADAFAAWRTAQGIARTGDMTLAQWQAAYDRFTVGGAAGPVAPAPQAATEDQPEDQTEDQTEDQPEYQITETQEDQTPMHTEDRTPAAPDLSRVLDGLSLVLSDKALEPLKAGIAALSRDREAAQAAAEQARHEKALALIDAEALRAVASPKRPARSLTPRSSRPSPFPT